LVLRVFVDHELCHLIVVCLFSGQVRHPDLLDGHISPFGEITGQPKYRAAFRVRPNKPFQARGTASG
jgi:hypothetical protein